MLRPIEDLYRDTPKYPHKKLYLTLPLPPSVNHMYYTSKRGHKRLTEKAEDYIVVSRALINEAIEEQKWLKQKKSTWFYIDLVFYMPDRRIRDSHNMLKLLLDVMQGIVYENDYYALPRIQHVEYDKENPRVEVIVLPKLNKLYKKALS